jgi:hypothetical protein
MEHVILGILDNIWSVASLTWWIFLPWGLFFPLRSLYLTYVQDRYIKSMSWVLLEIKVPKDVLKTPKAMEQVFAAMFADYSHGFTFPQRYLDGVVDSWYSFEIVGHAGGVHFYIFTQKKRRNLVESAIYAQYPEAEINEVPDYVNIFGDTLPNERYDIWGTDLVLARESAYPLRTYPYFEESIEERRVDPIAAVVEVMSNLKDDEAIWLQIVISPSDNSLRVGNNWKEEGEAIINKITGQREVASKKTKGVTLIDWLSNFFWAPIEYPSWPTAKEEKPQSVLKFLNPVEQDVVKAIANKISKFGFETNIRFIYIDKRENFNTANAVAVIGAIRQFNTQDLNNLKPGKQLTVNKGWRYRLLPFWKDIELNYKKRVLFSSYRTRRLNSRRVGKFRPSGGKISTLNTEELATLYHFPISLVEAPQLRRLDTHKGAPPPGLPVE